MENKRGGIRSGAGRKPTDNPKKAITIYVEKKTIWLFGNEEKLKKEVYGFINTTVIGNNDAGMGQKSFSSTVLDIGIKNVPGSINKPIAHQDEPLCFDKLKTDTIKKICQYDAYLNEINCVTELSEFPAIVKAIEKDMSLSPQQITKLKMISIEKSKGFEF